MTVEEALPFFENLPRIVRAAFQTLMDVGLSYMKLGQPSTELSGGEAQRVKLATELAKRLHRQTIYILTSPPPACTATCTSSLRCSSVWWRRATQSWSSSTQSLSHFCASPARRRSWKRRWTVCCGSSTTACFWKDRAAGRRHGRGNKRNRPAFIAGTGNVTLWTKQTNSAAPAAHRNRKKRDLPERGERLHRSASGCRRRRAGDGRGLSVHAAPGEASRSRARERHPTRRAVQGVLSHALAAGGEKHIYEYRLRRGARHRLPATAAVLVNRFGSHTLEILSDSPEKARRDQGHQRAPRAGHFRNVPPSDRHAASDGISCRERPQARICHAAL